MVGEVLASSQAVFCHSPLTVLMFKSSSIPPHPTPPHPAPPPQWVPRHFLPPLPSLKISGFYFFFFLVFPQRWRRVYTHVNTSANWIRMCVCIVRVCVCIFRVGFYLFIIIEILSYFTTHNKWFFPFSLKKHLLFFILRNVGEILRV